MSHLSSIENKIIDKEKASLLMKVWGLKGDKIVFTNGCFDLLHRGHITYLSQAAQEGNRLIVGINSDASVKSLEKGKERPVTKELDRAFVLAGLGFIDAIIIFNENTPKELIDFLQPDVLVKGGDYDAEEKNSSSKKYIVGREIVLNKGGKVITIPTVEGYSTTGILAKI
jgi:rfaE bifunctional protein nucleotidyltransferase chain/domain